MAKNHKTQKESRLQNIKAKVDIKDSWLTKTEDIRIILDYKISMTIILRKSLENVSKGQAYKKKTHSRNEKLIGWVAAKQKQLK